MLHGQITADMVFTTTKRVNELRWEMNDHILFTMKPKTVKRHIKQSIRIQYKNSSLAYLIHVS